LRALKSASNSVKSVLLGDLRYGISATLMIWTSNPSEEQTTLYETCLSGDTLSIGRQMLNTVEIWS